MVPWRPTRPSELTPKKRCPFHYRGLECKSRKSRNTWSNRQIWSWNMEWSRAKANRVLRRERIGHSKHPLPTTEETVADFIFGGSKIIADGDCSHEIKRHLLLGRKVMTNLDSILKSRDITLSTKVHLVKAMVFPVVMYRCESWTLKKLSTEEEAFELWCWKRLLRVPWTARRSKQSILKISPGCSLEGLMLKLKLQYFGHLMWRADLFEKTLMLGKDGWWEEKEMTEDEMVGCHHQLNGHESE